MGLDPDPEGGKTALQHTDRSVGILWNATCRIPQGDQVVSGEIALGHKSSPGNGFGHPFGNSIGFPANCLPCHAMARETVVDSRQEILRTAARLFQQRGYDATSMNDVAAALKLSKGGLYHHFQSKDEILFEIMDHAMDITQERVINPVRGIADPEERLRALIRLHIEVVLSPRDREITVMLHENHPLPPLCASASIRAKRTTSTFVESLMAEVQTGLGSRRKATVSPRAAAFALLGMINWIYQWYKPEGDLQAQNLIPQFTDLVFGGLLA